MLKKVILFALLLTLGLTASAESLTNLKSALSSNSQRKTSQKHPTTRYAGKDFNETAANSNLKVIC